MSRPRTSRAASSRRSASRRRAGSTKPKWNAWSARPKLVDFRNQADAAIYTAEKALKDAEGRLPADVKSDIDGAVSALRAVMQRDQAQPIRDGIERLRRASMRIGEAPNRAGQGSGGQGSGAGDNPDVIDAEFKEVDDDHRKAS